MSAARFRLALIAAVFAAIPACRCSSSSAPAPVTTTLPSAATSGTTAAANAPPTSIDPIASLDGCIVGHEGALLDIGDKSARGFFSHARDGDIDTIEREGATYGRIRAKNVTLSYFAGSEGDDEGATYVTARVRGGAAKSAAVFVNGKQVGVWNLTKDQVTIVTARATQKLLTSGDNEIAIHFSGIPKTANGQPVAELDWIHIGSGDVDTTYAAPTRSDISAHSTLAGVSKEAYALRSPGFLRCIGWLPKSGAVTFAAGVSGDGEVDLEVRALKDRAAPRVLQKLTVQSGQAWTSASLPLDDDTSEGDGTLGAIEFAVTRSTKDARLLLGEPKVIQNPAPPLPTRAAARGVVVVVLGDVSLHALRLYGGQTDLPALDALASQGMVFEQHRAGTTFPSGVLASILSGRPAHAIKMDLPDARLPNAVVTVADAARQAGVVTGIFSGNPTTGTAFGFDRSWSTIGSRPPDENTATNVFDDAGVWIEAHKSERFLAVIHARGGHPPWDAAPDVLKNLPPANYIGSLDPRNAGELLARARHVPPALHLTDADRERMWALYASSLTASDVALGKLLESIAHSGREQDTMVIVTGDVPVDESARVPFGEGGPPEEIALLVPLVVRPVAHGSATLRVRHRTADVDIARTMLDALGLTAPPDFQGIDLMTTAMSGAPANGRPLLATARDRYALAWGDFILAGSPRHELVCVASLDPSCALDTRSTHPIAEHALTQRAALDLASADPTKVVTEPVKPEILSAPMMRTWGRTP